MGANKHRLFTHRRKIVHEKVLRDYPNRDVQVNFTMYWWDDLEKRHDGDLTLMAIVGRFGRRIAIDRYNARTIVSVND